MAPIHNAASRGQLNGVRALLNSGTHVNARDSSRKTPLLIAAYNGYLPVVRELLDRGANVNARDRDEMTPLIWAVHNRYLAVVKLLLDRGANIEAQDNYGMTALLWAIHKGRLEFVKLLLERGANTNGVLKNPRIKRNMSANIRNAIIKHNAGLTIAKHYKAATLRRRLSFIGSNMAKSLPRNMTRKILTARKNK